MFLAIWLRNKKHDFLVLTFIWRPTVSLGISLMHHNVYFSVISTDRQMFETLFEPIQNQQNNVRVYFSVILTDRKMFETLFEPIKNQQNNLCTKRRLRSILATAKLYHSLYCLFV